MTLGHGAMAVETPFFIYLGLTLLVFGSGFFKPNMTSIISEMYKGKKDRVFIVINAKVKDRQQADSFITI